MKIETIIKKVREIDNALAYGDGFSDEELPNLRRRLKGYHARLELAWHECEAELEDVALCKDVLEAIEATMEEVREEGK